MATTAAVAGEVEEQRDKDPHHGLFEGRKLWFSRAVPQRTWLMQNAEMHGAQIVLLEQQADIRLVDHLKRNQAPGTHSYRYVELSIQNGVLEDLDAHRVGSVSRVDRPIGSVITAGKGNRNKFTETEDQMLWNWVKPHMDAGGAWKGLEIYKQLESVYPNHTYQSWRDRWIKHTQFQKRKITSQDSDGVNQSHAHVEERPRSSKQRRIEQRQPQRANIGVVHSSLPHDPRQDPTLRQVVHSQAMGNSQSSETNFHKRYEHERIHQSTDSHNNTGAAGPAMALTNIDEGPKDRKQTPSGNNMQHDCRSKRQEGSEKEVEPRGEAFSNGLKITTVDNIDDAESSVSVDDKRLPLAYDFTQEEACMLYKATCHILDARSDKLDESWVGVAKEYGHTKEAWQTFFYDIIVPEYKKRHGITTETQLETHYKEQLRKRRRELKASIAQQQMPEPTENVVGADQQAFNTVQEVPETCIHSTKHQEGDLAGYANVQQAQEDQTCTQSSTADKQPWKPQLSLHSNLVASAVNEPAGSPDNLVLQMLGAHADVDKTLMKLMKGVTKEQAISEQLKEHQAYVDEFSKIVEQQEAERTEDEETKILSKPAAAAITANDRLPKPNESRKLSQARGSRSISSLSHSQSVSASQPSQRSRNSHPLTAMLEPISDVSLKAGSEYDLDKSHEVSETPELQRQILETHPEASLGHKQKEASTPTVLQRTAIQQRSEEREENSGHFVTQISYNSQSSSTDNDSDLQDVPYRPTTQGIDEGDQSDVTGSALAVQLIEDEDGQSENKRSSEYTPSEVPSEGVMFESQIKLSHAWETAPERVSDGVNDDIEELQSDKEMTKRIDSSDAVQLFEKRPLSIVDQVMSDNQHRISAVEESSQDGQNIMNTSQKSPSAGLSALKTAQNDGQSDRHLSNYSRVETQSLFQQFVPDDLVDRFAIPEPSGGWDDNDEASFVNVTHVDAMHNPEDDHIQEAADWTLPLPDPEADYEVIPPPAPKDDNEADVDTWLANQPKLYPSIPSTLLKPLSHRALESTSMDLGLATTVLEHMADRLEKGKYPAHLPINNIKKLPKQERKSAIAKIANYLLPSHMPGCWTVGDDEALVGVNAREIKRVEDKHGQDRIKTRFEFLEMWHS